MKKKKHHVKTNAVRFLEKNKIPHETREFEVGETHASAKEIALSLGIEPEKLYKTIVLVGKQTGPIVTVIPSHQSLDLKKVAKVSGNKKVELLSLNDLEKVTGYVRGGCSPIGMKKHFPTYIANEADQCEEIYVSAGKRGYQMRLAPLDLQMATQAKLVDICE
ncbi:Cys-tRNA(Pro) deacylase [Vagococcus lutrae]|uniref:Cys-tRNA(Pro) deacylase n=1 Tax=Vagococcus lutrae TaxID=81947 RepID=UPI0020978515|nr:Cys-tRNA(Pro) deacylase [Vagococcus lutrae]MCO7151064.1 Cys-tRNA(Pro) deacylase [Vagococcus lutrae]MDT2802077.1 Cys-tRNA(Pro) deacylase [Vagococcus lutrae]MDT2826267.1 Cys-tRNA(Pro) deacylase [Vagococcus lutrae]